MDRRWVNAGWEKPREVTREEMVEGLGGGGVIFWEEERGRGGDGGRREEEGEEGRQAGRGPAGLLKKVDQK